MTAARGAITSSICAASSRVGTRMRALGWRRPCPPRGTADSRERIAKPNASVLPAPVGALPQTSRPASASGNVAAWIGNGEWIPRCASADASAGGTPRAEKRAGAKAGEDVLMRLQSVQKEDGQLDATSRGPGWHQSCQPPPGIALRYRAIG